MIEEFLIPFTAIGLAELGDKTQIAVICLASKTKRHLRLLAGVMLAFIIADGGAIILGSLLSGLIDSDILKFISGGLFIFFGIMTLLNNKQETADCDLRRPFMTGFGMILVSEMGDKTQLASAVFGARYNPAAVFTGVVASLLLLSFAAVMLGKFILTKLERRTISRFAGAVFLGIGIFFIVGG